MVKPPKGQQEDNKQRKTAFPANQISEIADLRLQEALIQAGFPQYVEDFTQSIRELLENLSHQLAVAELCIKQRCSWKKYERLKVQQKISKSDMDCR